MACERPSPRVTGAHSWQERHACTTPWLRTFFLRAYTGRDWQGWVCTRKGSKGWGSLLSFR